MTDEEKVLAVARANASQSRLVNETLDQGVEVADSRIAQSKEILSRHGRTETETGTAQPLLGSPLVIRPFDQLAVEAQAANPSPARIEDLLSPSEIEAVGSRVDSVREDFRRLHRMDSIDYAIAGCAGLLGALVDIFLVQMPKSPGFLGGQRTSGGPLANWLRDRINSTVPSERLSWLEREFKVPYDASVSTKLAQKIEGLSPRTHRFHSLGHDPLLGFIFGVGDIMGSKMSAIDKSGNFISQAVGYCS
jgi:hypothetical protein